jgi:urease accessory protein
MKLSTNTDFTKFPRAGSVLHAGSLAEAPASGRAVLPHDERHLRRRALALESGERILVDLVEPVALSSGDRLVLEDGRQVEIVAAPEELLEIRARDAVHLAELAWHIGNRHLAAAIEEGRILILHDHVIEAMLEGLGATVAEVVEPFEPVRGAYSGHEPRGHGHAAPDAYGRMPDDPHYGHNHGPGEHHHAHDHHDHDHDHHDHSHDHHGHGERDAFGRLPGDPHYGHNHA